MNIPGSKINLPSLTEKDVEDLTFGVKAGFDYVAASFIRKPEDVIKIREVLVNNGGEHIKIISKIENREGIENFDKILEVSDGIMVARGDLGVEIPMEEVPIRQKEFIQKCIKAGKPVVTATQMLESMTNNPRPTRAEVSDVANAVYDMTSAVMLSGESATGKYPIKCVETMGRICEAVENYLKYWKRFRNRERRIEEADSEYNLNYATCSTAMDLDAKAIFAYTDTGRTAKRIAGFVPQCPVYAVTANEQLCRELSLIWGTYAILVEKNDNIDKMIEEGVKKAKEQGLVETGDLVVIAGGASILAGVRKDLNKTIGGILKV
jgi:pyruvate kinase